MPALQTLYGARAEATALVRAHDGQAGRIAEQKINAAILKNDLELALHLDRVRREVEAIEG